MKNLNVWKSLVFIIALMILNSSIAFGQGNNWRLDGNNISNKKFIGTTNYQDFVVKTNDSTRMIVTKDGDININQTITADSIHVRSIRIGQNSLWIGGTPQIPAGSDYIQSSEGFINFGNTVMSDFGNITVAIAKQINTPNINPYPNIKLDVGGGINVDQDQGYCINSRLVLSDKGNSNLFVGYNSGANNNSSTNTGMGNTFFGNNSGANNTTGNFNLMSGNNAGMNNSTGSNNVFLGPAVATYNTTGSMNAFIGHASGNKNTGNNNTFLGYRSGINNTSGNYNTFIGNESKGATASLINAAAIGANATVSTDNSMVLGSINGVNEATANTNVAIGNTAPLRRLDVTDTQNPQIRLTQTNSTVYTDMQTTAAGDLYIAAKNGTLNRNVGVSNSTPKARLDVFANETDLAQLRLTYRNDRLYSEFKTTRNGDLLINTYNSLQKRRVGINLTNSTPSNTLEVNGDVCVRTLNIAPSKGIVTHNADGVLQSLKFTGSGHDVLLGDGTWGVVPSGGSADDDWTGAGTGEMYATYNHDNVSIGTNTSGNSKFRVYNEERPVAFDLFSNYSNYSSYTDARGIDLTLKGSNTINYGINSYVTNGIKENYGISAKVFNELETNSINCGVYGISEGVRINIGIKGEAIGGYESYGIYGVANQGERNYAGYFDGDVVITGDFPNPSDIMLKDNATSLNNSLNIIEQLNPVSFNYKVNEFPSMSLPEGEHYGLIAQEVELIIPALVSEATHPAKYDSLGNVISDEITYKTLNYTALIPFLIEAVKEQSDSIRELKNIISSYESRFTEIETLLAQCCQHDNGNHGDGNNGNDNAKSTDVNSVINITQDNSLTKASTELYQNVPNPFTSKTTFNYTLGTEGKVELIIMTYTGQYVTTLVNSNQESGNYSIDWNTTDIAPGIYFYALQVDGVEWVKKAIKLK